MAITNHERIGKAMDLLRAGRAPFVEREIPNHHQAQVTEALSCHALVQSWPETAWRAQAGGQPLPRYAELLPQPPE
jgi:hypothetical protein